LAAHVSGGVIAQEDLAAAGDPLYRPADAAGGPQKQHVLYISEVLGAKAAANVVGDEAHILRLSVERQCDMVAVDVDVLARDMERIALRFGIERADAAARLHWVDDDAVIVEFQAHDVCSHAKCRLSTRPVAGLPVEAGIARHFL
jgi:hypothetical protein